ncbi:MAG: tyrosine-type recombinase/integrase [Pseudomonadota bacterium]
MQASTAEWLQSFDQMLKARVSANTRLAYLRDVHRLVSLLDLPVLEWKPAYIQHVLIKLHSQGLSPRSLHRTLSSWRYFFRYLAEHHSIFEALLASPIKLPKAARPLPQTLTPDEINVVLESTNAPITIELQETQSGEASTLLDKEDKDKLLYQQLRYRVLAELLYSSGLRISEAASLVWGDIDIVNGMVRVTGKGGKMRDVPLGQKAIDALREWMDIILADSETPLFADAKGEALSVRTLQRDIQKLGKQSSVNRRLYPHLFRHSFASHILQSSGDLRAVQEMLGHSSLQATQVYTHLDFQHLSKVYDQAHPRAKMKKHGVQTSSALSDQSPLTEQDALLSSEHQDEPDA